MPPPARPENRAGADLLRLGIQRCRLKTGAVPSATIASRPESKGPASPVQLLPKTGQHLDLLRRLTDPLVEHPEETVTCADAVELPGSHDQLADRIQREAKRLGLPDKGEPAEVDLAVQSIPARSASRRRQDLSALIESQRPDREPGPTGDFADRHQAGQLSITDGRHGAHGKASTQEESQARGLDCRRSACDSGGRASVREGERP